MQEHTRRRFIGTISVGTVIASAGCIGSNEGSVELVVITSDSGGDPIPETSVTVDETTIETDSNAQARFEDMSPGSYEVLLEHPDYQSKEDEVEVPEGGHEKWYVEFNLEEA